MAKHGAWIKASLRRLGRIIIWLALGLLVAITSLRWVDPVTSSVIIQRNILALLEHDKPVSFKWVDWVAISPQLPLAVVASEDQRFPHHHGIDTTELRKAIRQGGHRGASTITQQVAKNMFLWQGRSYLRKALEAVLALYIDLVWGKQRVLEIYLNIAYFGENIYGVGPASEQFFSKLPRQLNRYESARLAAVLPSPDRFSVVNASRYVVDRQYWILRQMKQLGGVKYIEKL